MSKRALEIEEANCFWRQSDRAGRSSRATWPSVLTVGKENAERFGAYGRYSLHAGSALEVPFGDGFDVLLAASLLNRWDCETIETFLKQAHAVLVAKGQIIVVEFAPSDASTASEHTEMLRNAGFAALEVHALQPTPQTGMVGTNS